MKLLFALFFIFSFPAIAEYRVYQYVVTNKIQSTPNIEEKGRVIKSTMNPSSYLAYNGGATLIKVDLLRTWICPGDTSNFKKLCDSPYQKLDPKEAL